MDHKLDRTKGRLTMNITGNRLLALTRKASQEGRELSFRSVDSHLFGLIKKEDEITLSEASERLEANQKVRLEETSQHKETVSYSQQWIWQKRPRQHTGVVTRTERAHTDLESPEELAEFHAFKVDGEQTTERQKLAAKLQRYDDSSHWTLSNTKDPLFGDREASDLGLSAFEAADRINNGGVISVNELNVPRLIEGMVRSDTEMVSDAIEHHFVASPVDLQTF